MRGGERGVLAVGTEALLPVSVSDSLKRSAASGRQEEVRV
jgi:hypothetical protein